MHRLIHASHTTFRAACPQARTAVRATGGNGDGGPADAEGDSQTAVVVAPVEPALKRPRRYHVVIMNDDYTPMEFVIDVLERFFGLNVEQATVLMLQVHHQGRAAVGNYSRDVAETKAAMVVDHARQHEHPLLCQAEPVP